MKVVIYMNKTDWLLTRALKKKGKAQLGNPKSGRDRLWELSITKFKSQFKRGLTKVVVTRDEGLREWSQGELRL